MNYKLVALIVMMFPVFGCSKEKNEKPRTNVIGVQEIALDSIVNRPHHWILAAGQSNMLGYGMRNDPFPSNDHINVVGQVPIIGNYGPAYAYAMRWISREEIDVTIIQCSVGGSSIDSWQPGNTNFSNCRDQWLSQGSPKVDVLLWMQGEAEGMSGNVAMANQWADQFQNTVDGLRLQMGQMPVVYSQIGPNPGSQGQPIYEAWEVVKAHQDNLMMINAYRVKSDDLSLSDAWVHFDSTSYDTIGRRMFEAYHP